MSLVAGLYVGLVVAPTDTQQGEVYRIIFLYVSAAWMSMLTYLAMAGYCALGLVLRIWFSSIVASAFTPTDAFFTAVVLWTGALWDKSTWGTRWVWDARLTSELLLLFLYLGFIVLENAIEESFHAEHACTVLAVVDIVNLSMIYFPVQRQNTLHQGASISLTAAPPMAMTMLLGMLLIALTCWTYSIRVTLICVCCIMREHGDGDLDPATPA